MKQRYKCNHRDDLGKPGHRGGSSSFLMHSPDIVFNALALSEGNRFLDIGCGPGDYAMRASKEIGSPGLVYALDKSESNIDHLKQRSDAEGITNIVAMIADATKQLPISRGCIDVCLVATVLHIPDVAGRADVLCEEIRRVLNPDGRLAIIECHKKDLSFGPPQHMRLSPKDTEELIGRFGFKKTGIVDLGYNYFITFRLL